MFNFGHFFLAAFASISMMIHHPVPAYHHIKPVVSPTPTQNVQMLTATQTVTKYGKTATLTVSFPKDGGKITGKVTGDCTGTVNGTYSGENNGKQLQGTGHARCDVYFLTITGDATFSGTVNANDTTATVHYSGKANDRSQTGTFNLPLTLK